MKETTADGPTRYGFRWGPVAVDRLAHVEGRGRVIEVRTDHARIQVYVSEAGRVIRTTELAPYEQGVKI
jgi:hypothetical protein